MHNQINFFYLEFKEYIDYQKKQYLINKYRNLYLLIRKKIIRNKEENIFMKDYRNITKFVKKNNENYIQRNINNSIFNDINGFKLDDNQRRAILCDEINTLIIAGAGSGKSLTLIGKIKYLIEIKKIKPEHILCISFTNDSCNSLKDKLFYNVDVLTFHKLAMKILKKNNYLITTISLDYVVDEYFASIILTKPVMVRIVLKICGYKDNQLSIYEQIINSNQIKSLKRTIISFINLFKANNYAFNYLRKIKNSKNKYLLYLIMDIYTLYQQELRSQNEIDFNDMINCATEKIKKKKINLHYKYIIIDEFQDTSYTRYKLVKEIIKYGGSKLIAVGDDWQSIYGFTGCDVDIFINFEKYFGYTQKIYINNTYRNSQQLIDVAGKFIMQNRKQIKKQLKSVKSIDKPIKIIYETNNVLENIIDYICRSNKKEILILGRNNKDIFKYLNGNFTYSNSYIIYRKKSDIQIRYLTVHKSKGLEADCVIVINLIDGLLGFPCKQQDDEILKKVKRVKESKYGDERRLFYVALTRTKSNVYLIIPSQNYSCFVKEIIKKNKKFIEIIKL
ncbi:MAG: UvrD-helicase domain-containing protein [Bacilli bacterium]|nr:UvrD-helicase domain-containing protein [Bacilli bacterium]